MGIMSRLYRLCKADVHGVMDQLEDKQLLLKQYLREMEDSLKEKQDRLAATEETIRHVERDRNQRRQALEQLESDLDLSIAKNKDDIARMLIRKRRMIESSAGHLEQRLECLHEEQRHIQETLDRQKLQHEQLKVKISSFCAPASATRHLSSSGPQNDFSAWLTPTDEEIEIELLQRKNAQKLGGAP